MNTPSVTFRRWLPIALVATGAVSSSYLAVQQSMRLAANDPQIQAAQDLSAALTTGAAPQAVAAGTGVDLERSLALAVVVVDTNSNTLAGTAQLNGKLPQPPQGTLDYAKEHGSNRFTWEPKKGVRLATVIVPYDAKQPGYVVVTRSLKEVEQREVAIAKLAAAGLAVTLLLSLALVWLL